jgi:hypothetical protein
LDRSRARTSSRIRTAPFSKNEGVDDQIREEDHDREDSLPCGGEAVRVDDRQQITGDEIAFVRSAAEAPQPVLQRREGADPPRQFDDEAPGGGRKVQPGDPGPAKDEKPPGDDEDDEEEVPDRDRVREELVHADS